MGSLTITFVANLSLSLKVKEFWKSVKIRKLPRVWWSSFFGTQCMFLLLNFASYICLFNDNSCYTNNTDWQSTDHQNANKNFIYLIRRSCITISPLPGESFVVSFSTLYTQSWSCITLISYQSFYTNLNAGQSPRWMQAGLMLLISGAWERCLESNRTNFFAMMQWG